MRSQVYRNLDKPFQIMGFNVFELSALCIVLVGGGEIAQALGVSHIWSFLATLVLGLTLAWFRHSLGDYFIRRLFRFYTLPRELTAKLIMLKGTHK